jgi:hypothetical protein
MPDYIGTAPVDANGNATFTLQSIPTGKEWVVQQTAVATIPLVTGAGCVATLYRNGQVITSTNQGSAGSAGGQPYYRLTSVDNFSCKWTGGPAGGQANITISYSEHVIGTASPMNTGIV